MVGRSRRALIRQQLRLLRTRLGKSQIDVETDAGLPRGKYWRIENGYDEPTDTERARLAKALRVSADELGFQADVKAAS